MKTTMKAVERSRADKMANKRNGTKEDSAKDRRQDKRMQMTGKCPKCGKSISACTCKK